MNAPTNPPKTQSKSVDLTPGALSFIAGSAPDGSILPVSLALNNLQPGTPDQPYVVDFYLALSSTFLPATDAKVASVVVPSGPAGDSTLMVAANLSIPAGVLNQAVYLYAVIDALGAVMETNTANNTSTVVDSGVVLVYDSGNPARTYKILLATYAPATGSTADTMMALYKNVAGTAIYTGLVSNDGGAAGYAAIDTTTAPLGPGTYYVVVSSWNAGPYGMAVRTSGIDLVHFAPIGSNAQDPKEPDNTPQIWPLTQSLSLPPLPSTPEAILAGTMVNRYSGNGDWDWFTFTLP